MATDHQTTESADERGIFGQWQYQQTVSILSFFALFAVMTSRIVISPVVPEINAAFNISESDIGLAITGMAMVYAVTQFASGVLSDRYGERRIVLLALGLTAAGSVLLALSPSFTGLVLFAGLLGAGSGLYRTAAESLLNRVTSDSDSAISSHAAGAAAAGLVAPTGAVLAANHFGWRVAIVLGGIAAVTVVVPFWWFTHSTGAPSPSSSSSTGDLGVTMVDFRSLGSSPAVLYTTGIGVLGNFVFEAFLTFFPLFLIQCWGFSAGRAGAAFGVVAFCSVVGLLVVGRIAETYVPRDAVLMGLYALAGIGFVLLLFGWDPTAVWLGAVLLGMGLSWSGLITSRFLMIETDVGQGTALGLHKTTVLLIGSLGPMTVGTLSEAFGWTVAYGLIVALLTLVTLSLCLTWILSLDI